MFRESHTGGSLAVTRAILGRQVSREVPDIDTLAL
jgi:hypothetical protein